MTMKPDHAQITIATAQQALENLAYGDMTWETAEILHQSQRMDLLRRVASGELSAQAAQELASIPFGDFEILSEPDPEVFDLPEQNEED